MKNVMGPDPAGQKSTVPTGFRSSSLIFREEPMIPEDHDEVDLNDFDPKADRQQHSRSQYDEDEEGHGAHGPGVSCATQ